MLAFAVDGEVRWVGKPSWRWLEKGKPSGGTIGLSADPQQAGLQESSAGMRPKTMEGGKANKSRTHQLGPREGLTGDLE